MPYDGVARDRRAVDPYRYDPAKHQLPYPLSEPSWAGPLIQWGELILKSVGHDAEHERGEKLPHVPDVLDMHQVFVSAEHARNDHVVRACDDRSEQNPGRGRTRSGEPCDKGRIGAQLVGNV